MSFFVVLNIFANTIICLGITSFFVLLFGNSNSVVHKWPVLQHWSLKTALVSIIVTTWANIDQDNYVSSKSIGRMDAKYRIASEK